MLVRISEKFGLTGHVTFFRKKMNWKEILITFCGFKKHLILFINQ